MNAVKELIKKAKCLNKTIVFPEAGFSDRIVKAGIICAEEKIAKIIFLVESDESLEKYNIVENDYLKIINIKTHEIRPMLVSALYEKRKDKGLTEADAEKLIDNPVYFGTMMVELSLADGLVAGAEISTAETFKPAFQIIKGKTKETKISSFFVMVKDESDGQKIYVLSDCGININPTTEEIVEIAKLYAGQGALVEDLIGEGNVALATAVTMLECVESVDEVEGFLGKMIMDAMQDYIGEDADNRGIDEQILDKVNNIYTKAKEMAEELLRKVTVSELAKEMEIEEDEILEAIRLSANNMDYIEDGTKDGQ